MKLVVVKFKWIKIKILNSIYPTEWSFICPFLNLIKYKQPDWEAASDLTISVKPGNLFPISHENFTWRFLVLGGFIFPVATAFWETRFSNLKLPSFFFFLLPKYNFRDILGCLQLTLISFESRDVLDNKQETQFQLHFLTGIC